VRLVLNYSATYVINAEVTTNEDTSLRPADLYLVSHLQKSLDLAAEPEITLYILWVLIYFCLRDEHATRKTFPSTRILNALQRRRGNIGKK